MIKIIFFTFIFLSKSLSLFSAEHSEYSGKKALYVNSYHPGYAWSDGEQEAAVRLLSDAGVEVKVMHLDAKNHSDPEEAQEAAFEVKKTINSFQPDVLIVADDSAFKYVVEEYYRDAELPVVFCGINWDLSIYQAPYRNTTGMIEIALTEQLAAYLKSFAAGSKIGILAYDVWDERKNVEYSSHYLPEGFYRQEYASNFHEWKEKFLRLQEETDAIVLAAPEGLDDWDLAQAERFILENAVVPTGVSGSAEAIPLALVGLVKVPQEQGAYAAYAALKILDGKRPGDVPIVTNKSGHLLLNLKVADKLDVIFTPAMLRNAVLIYGIKE
jgi:hypothetical protein